MQRDLGLILIFDLDLALIPTIFLCNRALSCQEVLTLYHSPPNSWNRKYDKIFFSEILFNVILAVCFYVFILDFILQSTKAQLILITVKKINSRIDKASEIFTSYTFIFSLICLAPYLFHRGVASIGGTRPYQPS